MGPVDASVTRRSRLEIAVACFAIVAIVVHDAAHVSAGRYYDVFWVCNVSAVILGPALLARSPTAVFVAFAWLIPGTIVWLVDAFVAGSSILVTSYAVHLGGSAAAVWGVRRLGYARRGWIAALLVFVGALVFSRLFLPAHANVNAAHAIPSGWTFLGSSRGVFIAVSVALAAALCLGAQLAARGLTRWRRPGGALEE